MAASIDGRRILLVFGVFLCVGCYVGVSEIHRAKSLNAKPRLHHHNQYQYPLWPPNYGRLLTLQPFQWNDRNDTTIKWMHEVVWGHELRTWLFSILSSCLVGLSGIFPLLIIPVEAGQSLRSGVASDRLKLLLSFAVGGLLGDVFLHLLPEAWAHLQKLGGEKKGHLQIGLWLMAGLLSFFIIQKMFPEDKEEEEEEAVAENEVSVETQMSKDLPISEPHNYLDSAKMMGQAKGMAKPNGAIKDGKKKKERPENGTKKNGYTKPRLDLVLENKKSNKSSKQKDVIKLYSKENSDGQQCSDDETRWLDSVKKWIVGHDDSDNMKTNNTHIKTSGWLNLVANMIDNFTHGLAVAGSYSISTKTGLLTTVAILLHEVPHEIGDFAILLKAGFDRWKAAKAQIVTATGGMLGALIALAAESTKEAGDSTAWILPFTAGGFIYIALVTVVPDLLKEVNPWSSLKQFLSLCAGIATMALVTVVVD